jgi:flagellar hook-basal body complex protein FliE
MAEGVSNAIAAYRAALTRTAEASSKLDGGARPEGGFADMLRDAVGGAVNDVRQSEQVGMQAMAGEASLTDVVTAVTNAEVALQTVLSVRDRVISAYQEVLRTPM